MVLTKYKRLTGSLAVLLGLLFALDGCALLSRFQPNTLVKEFQTKSERLKVGDYGVTILMLAREIGNREGVDDYRIIFQFKSDKAIKNSKDSLALPIPRLKTLKVASADDRQFEAEIDQSGLDQRPLSDPPQVFRQHYFEYFDLRDVFVPAELSEIKIEVSVEFYDRQSLKADGEANFSASLQKSESMEWYKPISSELDLDNEEIEP